MVYAPPLEPAEANLAPSRHRSVRSKQRDTNGRNHVHAISPTAPSRITRSSTLATASNTSSAMFSKDTKHSDVSRQLRSEIAAGVFAPGDRLPGEPQLVKRFQVSRPTISRALQDLQNEGLIERRAGAGTFVRSGPPIAIATRMIGVLTPGLSDTHKAGTIIGELAALARLNDYGLLRGTAGNTASKDHVDLKQDAQVCAQFIEQRVAGVFIICSNLFPEQEEGYATLAEKLHQAGIAVTLVGQRLQTGTSDFDVVSTDDFASGRILMEHLLQLGCKRISFAVRNMACTTGQARLAGAIQALMQHRHLELDHRSFHVGDPNDLKFVRSMITSGEADAYFCATDNTAAPLIRTLEKCNTPVPRKVRVVGFEDEKQIKAGQVALTSMQDPNRDIASTAFRAMMERIADPSLPVRHFSLTASLAVRGSCGAYPSKK